MKNVITRFILCFILCFSLLLIFPTYSYSLNNTNDPNSKYTSSHDQSFDIVPKSSYCYSIDENAKSATGYISFSERAKSFKILFKNKSTGKIIFSKNFFMAGPVDDDGNPQGVKSILFNIAMDGLSSYEIIVQNEDTVIISGDLSLSY